MNSKLVSIKKVKILCGKRGSGKSFQAKKLEKILKVDGLSVKILPIAYELKKSFCNHTGVDICKMLHDYDYKTKNREALMQYSREIKEIHGEEYWINYLLTSLMEMIIDVIIIPDVRVKLELKKIKEFCSTYSIELETIRMEIPMWVRKKRGIIYNAKIDENSFETDLDGEIGWDIIHTKHEYTKE